MFFIAFLFCAVLLAGGVGLFSHERIDYVHNPTVLTDRQIDVAQAALAFSKFMHPDVDISSYTKKLAALAYEVKAEVRGSKEPNDQMVAMNKVIFVREGYGYDTEGVERDDPDVSLLSHLMDTKRGNCFALQILYMAVAQMCGYPIFMVSVPSHAYLRYVGEEEVFNIDATAQGKIYRDDSYMEMFSVKKEAIELGSYCRALSNREFLGELLADTALLIEGGIEEQKKKVAMLENAVTLNPLFPSAYITLAQAHTALAILTPGDESWGHFNESYEHEMTADDLGFVPNDETKFAKEKKKG